MGALVKKRKSKSAKAGLIFPVSRINRYLRKNNHRYRIGGVSPVYLAAVLEYLSAEVLELAGNAAKDNKKRRINPRHILLSISNDAEIRKLLKDVTIPSAGFIPDYRFIISRSPFLKPKPKKVVNISKAVPKNRQIKKTIKKASPKKNKSKVVYKHFQAQPVQAAVKPSTTKKYKPGDAPKIKILSEKKLFLGQKLTVVQGSIVDVMADAIVNPTNSCFYMGGQVGQTLMKVGGEEFEKEVDGLKAKKTLPSAGVEICTGYNFMAEKVIHCNGPVYREKSCTDTLKNAIKNCLSLADLHNLKSLAFPCIGSGRAGFPKAEAAEIVLKSITDYFVTVMSTSINQIYFVLYDKEAIDIYTKQISLCK